MNAAFVSLSMSRKAGGLFECMRRLGGTLAAEQATRVEVLALADKFSDDDLNAWSPLRAHAFPARRLLGFAISSKMGQYMRELEADLIHTHGLWSYASIGVSDWAVRTKRPYLVSPHGMLDPWALANSGWKKRLAARWFERRHLERATCLHALCVAEAEAIRDYGLRNPICVIPNGVDLPKLDFVASEPAPWATANPAARKVMLYLGRIHPKKGLPNFLRAWAEIQHLQPREINEWMLVIAGWDQKSHMEELRRLARELSVDASVHFAGPLFDEAKASAYRHAQAFVLPSFSEGLPLVVLEAWAHSLPVIMTSACNLPEGFAAGAALQSGSHPEELAVALGKLISFTATERKKMGQRGRALVEQRFTWSSAAAQTAQVYRWTKGTGDRPSNVQF